MIPTYEEYMLPIMQLAADGKIRKSSDFYEVAKDLPDADKGQILQSGREPIYQNRISWAKSYLFKAGFLDRIARNQYVISQLGKKFINTKPNTLSTKILEEYSENFHDWVSKVEDNKPKSSSTKLQESTTKTFDEQIDEAFKALQEKLAEDIIDKILSQDDLFFERLVMNLLEKMGYGAGQLTKKSHDEGIDAIINADQLGLDKIYIQAKRWKAGNNVSRKELQSFAGAIDGAHGNKGVFITTSDFTNEAKEYTSNNTKIIKINGMKLAEYMIKFNLGVSVDHSYEIKKIDTDFFEEE